MLCLSLLSSPIPVRALSQEDYNAIYGDHTFYQDVVDCGAQKTTGVAAGTLTSGGKVYILGDSITVRSAPAYTQQFGEKNITPIMSGVVGRSWKTPGSGQTVGSPGTGSNAVDTDRDAIAAANGIIIALGTNGYLGNNPPDEVIQKVRSINPSAPIWWVNIANVGGGNGVSEFNNALDAGTKGAYTVIPWSKTVDPTGDGTNDPNHLLDDGTHPSIPAGVNTLVGQVVGATTSGSMNSDGTTTNLAKCSCGKSQGSATNLTGSNNTEKAFNYFVSVGFKPEQAAGILGNMRVESTVEPVIEQGKTPTNSRSVEEFIASGDSRRTDSNAPGYGLVQWTGYGQLDKMAEWVSGQGQNPNSLEGQLAYINFQLGDEKKSIGDAIKASSTVEEATIIWNVQYENSGDSRHPGSAGWNLRIQYANDIFAQYGSNPGASGSGSVACPNNTTLAGGFSLPVDKHWFDEHPDWFSKPHHDYPASDIPVPSDTPVFSMTAGTVSTAPAGGDCGLGVTIDAGNDISFVYCHGSDGGALVHVGDKVSPGQLIMHSDNTGHSFGPHLHLGIKIKGVGHCPQTLFAAIVSGNPLDINSLPTSGCTS